MGRGGFLALCLAAPLVGADCVDVIAHRGASGYLPEHTLPAYALGYGHGAHWIEPDLVLTADGVPIALHDVTLDRTTNVADVFPDRARADGQFHAADFQWAEIRRLMTRDAPPRRFPDMAFAIPSFEQVVQLVAGLNRTTGRRVGIYPELKRPDLQPGLTAAVLDVLAAYDLPVLVQSFDATALAALETDYPRIQLLGKPVSGAELERIGDYAAGVGVHKALLLKDSSLVERAHGLGLAVHAFTLRADAVGPGFPSFEAEIRALAGMGLDAVFTDHPDQVLALTASGRGSACD